MASLNVVANILYHTLLLLINVLTQNLISNILIPSLVMSNSCSESFKCFGTEVVAPTTLRKMIFDHLFKKQAGCKISFGSLTRLMAFSWKTTSTYFQFSLYIFLLVLG